MVILEPEHPNTLRIWGSWLVSSVRFLDIFEGGGDLPWRISCVGEEGWMESSASLQSVEMLIEVYHKSREDITARELSYL